jgi:tetratricopeptide (TPR) repeat protein
VGRFHSIFLAFLLLGILCASALAAPGDDDDKAQADGGEAELADVEAMRRKAEREGEWAMSKDELISVDNRVLNKPWNKVPFDGSTFDMTHDQIRANWDALMSGLGVPYPSAEVLRAAYARFPQLREAHKGFDGDFGKLERDLNELWRLFFRGDYQAAMQYGQKLGPMGRLAGKVAQVFYAVYLEPNLDDKHMLLQDSANAIREFGSAFEQMKKDRDPVFRNNYVVARLAYIYSIGRIAEDVPIPVAIGRNYVFKVLGAIDDMQTLAPKNPLGIAARAGADANVVRKVGKATGRVTFGARQATIRQDFETALRTADLAVIRYEYANAILYLNKKRDIAEAIEQLKKAAATKPRFAMEALDAMYAHKRLREVEALAKSPASFRKFERARLRYQKENRMNLSCVLAEVCKPFLIP